jgi:hypothetical protein
MATLSEIIMISWFLLLEGQEAKDAVLKREKAIGRRQPLVVP